MFEKSSLKKNMALQTLYEVIGTCIPLVTSPYLSRVLGPSQLGIFSFTSSVVAYFLLFSKLGNANLGVRSIASLGDDKQGRSTSFWGLFSFQAITTTLCLALYIVYLRRKRFQTAGPGTSSHKSGRSPPGPAAPRGSRRGRIPPP